MLISLLILSISFVFAQDTKPVADHREFRAFVSDINYIDNSVSVAGVKIALDADGQNNSASAEIDAGGFKFIASKLRGQVALGFAGLSATAKVDWSPNPNGDGKFIYSVAAAWAEIVMGLSTIFLYEERNKEDGFQYNLGDDVWNCGQNNGKDCFIAGSNIEVTDLYYDGVAVDKAACPASAGYSTECNIWTIHTVGYLDVTKTVPVFELSFKVSNQKVVVGTHQIGPDYGKLDWTIRYPWTAKSVDRTKSNVAISGYAGGKVGNGAIVGGRFLDKDSYVFQGDNDKAAVLAWDGTATLGTSKESAIYVNGISGKSILEYNCQIGINCDPVSAVIIGVWQLAVGFATAGGWTAELFILSWNGVGPDAVVYDPTIGMAATSEIQTNASFFLMPSIFSFIAPLCFLVFFSRH